MTSRALLAALLGTLLCGAAVGVATSSRPHPQDPIVRVPEPRGTLILTVEIDHRGVRVLQATRKPDLAFRSPRHAPEMDFRWTLRDAAGRALAESGFDPFRICLDPTHAGLPPHVEGDVRIPHVAHANVKVPDLAGAASIDFALRDAGVVRPFGSVAHDTFPVR